MHLKVAMESMPKKNAKSMESIFWFLQLTLGCLRVRLGVVAGVWLLGYGSFAERSTEEVPPSSHASPGTSAADDATRWAR